MLERSQPALEYVEISDEDLTETEISTLLRRFPSLTNLHMDIIGCIINPHLFDILSIEDTTSDSDHHRRPSSILCPKLTTLMVNYCPDVKTGPVLRLIKLRNDTAGEATVRVDLGLSRINKLSLDGCEIEAEHLPWFRRMVPVFSCVYQTRKEAKVSRR